MARWRGDNAACEAARRQRGLRPAARRRRGLAAAPRLEVFDQPDVQTPGGTYIWSEGSSTPTPVKAAARERIPKKSPFKVDFDGNVPYSASRPFQVDFVSKWLHILIQVIGYDRTVDDMT